MTDLDPHASFIIDAYHQLWHVEHSFRMSKHDLKARPIYSRTRESIDARLAVVFAALAVSHRDRATCRLDHQEIRPGLAALPASQLNAGTQTITAEQPVPDEIRTTLAKIHQLPGN